MTATISLCMIVKNESQNLHRCLQSVQGFVNEIIVVDTGSEDNTVEIARNYGAKVYFFEWCNDFASARNYSLSFATSDWILILDADEKLVVNDRELILNTLDLFSQIDGFTVPLISIHDSNESSCPQLAPRLFRNFLNTVYCGAYHEALCYKNNLGVLFYTDLNLCDNLSIEHYGYTQELLTYKNLNRNIPILEAERKSQELSFLLLYTLLDAYINTDQNEKAEDCYKEGFERLWPYLIEKRKPEPFAGVVNLLYLIGLKSYQAKDFETTNLICHVGLIWEPNSPHFNYLAGAMLTNLGLALEAITYFEKCLQIGRTIKYSMVSTSQDLLGKLPAWGIGCNQLKLCNKEAAIEAFALALKFDPNFEEASNQIRALQITSEGSGQGTQAN